VERKLCGVCNRRKLVSEFHRRNAKYLQNMCKDCRREYHAMHYATNKLEYQLRAKTRQHELQQFIRSIKENGKCKDCGKKFHFMAMHFDHRPDEKKSMNLSLTGRQGWSKEKIEKEIAKCDLVCANCHAVRTFQRNAELV
jgi:hypothetical protein